MISSSKFRHVPVHMVLAVPLERAVIHALFATRACSAIPHGLQRVSIALENVAAVCMCKTSNIRLKLINSYYIFGYIYSGNMMLVS